MIKLSTFAQVSERSTLENMLMELDKFHFTEKKEDKHLSRITFVGRPSIKDVITYMTLKTGWSGRIFVGANVPEVSSGVYIPVVDYGPYVKRFPDDVYVRRITTHTYRDKRICCDKTDVFVEIGKSNSRKRKPTVH